MMSAANYIQIRPVELPLGEPLPWDLVDRRGILVLRQGTVITHEQQIERLLERRVCRERTEADLEATLTPVRLSVFEQLAALRSDLHAGLLGLAEGPGGGALDSLVAMAAQWRLLIGRHPDAMLGGLMLEQAAYTETHPLLVATISDMLARRAGVDEALRDSLCCAALTGNLGMLTLQDALSRQQSPLDDAQRRAVHDHPQQGFELLRSAGVDDPLWLGMVLHHHARSDGSGYPSARLSPRLEQLTSIIALADNYAAMVLPRAYREGLHAQQAVREIFVQKRLRVAPALAQQFVKELGIYPPGTFVTMKNGDLGLVIRRGDHAANAPVVSCFANAEGAPYASPLFHDTGEAGATVIAGVAASCELPMPLTRLWGLTR